MSVTRDEWDEQLGQWRWPEGENFVVRETDDAYYVTDEISKSSSFWAKDLIRVTEVGNHGLDAQALRAYLARERKTPKLWLDAKPGEVWLMQTDGAEFVMCAFQSLTGGARFRLNDMAGTVFDPAAPLFTAGRRIWPEVADA